MNKRDAKGVANTQLKSTESRYSNMDKNSPHSSDSRLVYGKRNYRIMGIGIALIVIGFILMGGGHMPSPDVWDESIIYSPRRTVLAPIFILAGFGLQIYAIFTRN